MPSWRDAKHISKSRCVKHTNTGPLIAVDEQMHFGTKHMSKPHLRPLVEVEMSKKDEKSVTSQNVKNKASSDHFWQSDVVLPADRQIENPIHDRKRNR